MVTYTWAVARMNAYSELDGETNVVFAVHWTLTGTDGTYTAGVYGSAGVTVDPDASFTPYADLTQEQVIGWVKSIMSNDGVAAYETAVAQQVADLANPPVVTPPLPWA